MSSSPCGSTEDNFIYIFSSALSSGFTHTINNNAGTIDGSSSGKSLQGGAGAITLTVTGGSASVLGDITGVARGL